MASFFAILISSRTTKPPQLAAFVIGPSRKRTFPFFRVSSPISTEESIFM